MAYLAELITAEFGERCPDFAEGCVCCEIWKAYDTLTAPGPLTAEEEDRAAHFFDRYAAGIDAYAQFDRVRPSAFGEGD